MDLPEELTPKVEPGATLPTRLPVADKTATPPQKDSRADMRILEAWATMAVMLSISGAPEALLAQAAEVGASYVKWRDNQPF